MPTEVTKTALKQVSFVDKIIKVGSTWKNFNDRIACIVDINYVQRKVKRGLSKKLAHYEIKYMYFHNAEIFQSTLSEFYESMNEIHE